MLRPLTLALLSAMFTGSAVAQNWTGAIDSDWNNPGNWTDWPLNGEDVTVDPANYSGAMAAPVIASASVFSPDRMYVQNGAELSIQASLSVADRLIISDGSEVTMTAGPLTTDRLVLELGGSFDLQNGAVSTLSVLALGDDGAQPSRFFQSAGSVTCSGEFGFDCEVGISHPVYEMNGGTLTVNGDAIWFATAPGGGQGRLLVNAGSAQVNGSLVNTLGTTIDVLIEVNGGTLTTNGPGIDLAHATDSIRISAGSLHCDGNVTIENDGVLESNAGDVYFDQLAELRGIGTYDFHNVTISPGATLQHTDPAEITVKGSWINQNIFDPDVNTVVFTGGTLQTVSNGNFHHLRVDNSSIGLGLVGPTTVTGSLVLDQGRVLTQLNDLLVLTDGATATSNSFDSFVQGPMKKIGDDDFVFPIGEDGSIRPLRISDINGNNTALIAQSVAQAPVDATSLIAPLEALDTTQHWWLTHDGSTGTVKVGLHWDQTATLPVDDCDSLVVANWTNTGWQALTSNATGDCTAGSGDVLATQSVEPIGGLFTFGKAQVMIGVEESMLEGMHAHVVDKDLYLSGVDHPVEVVVLDASGRAVHQLHVSTDAIVPLHITAGIYMIQCSVRNAVRTMQVMVTR